MEHRCFLSGGFAACSSVVPSIYGETVLSGKNGNESGRYYRWISGDSDDTYSSGKEFSSGSLILIGESFRSGQKRGTGYFKKTQTMESIDRLYACVFWVEHHATQSKTTGKRPDYQHAYGELLWRLWQHP